MPATIIPSVPNLMPTGNRQGTWVEFSAGPVSDSIGPGGSNPRLWYNTEDGSVVRTAPNENPATMNPFTTWIRQFGGGGLTPQGIGLWPWQTADQQNWAKDMQIKSADIGATQPIRTINSDGTEVAGRQGTTSTPTIATSESTSPTGTITGGEGTSSSSTGKLSQSEYMNDLGRLVASGQMTPEEARQRLSGYTPNSGPSGPPAPRPDQGAEQFPEGIRSWALAYKAEHGYFPGQAPSDFYGTTPYYPQQMRPMSTASMFPQQFTEYGDVAPWYAMAQNARNQQSPDFRAGTSIDSYAADLANQAWGNQFYDLNKRAPTQDEWVWHYYNSEGQDPRWLNP